jgi:hypothetical protein
MTFRRRIGDFDGGEALELASLWCEGNLYGPAPSHRFQLVDIDTNRCEQVCDLQPPDQNCVFPADIGRAARRKPEAFYDSMVVEIVSLPEERASRCDGDVEHAEAWKVAIVEHRSTGLGGQPTLRQPLEKPTATLWVACPGPERPAAGALIETRVARGSSESCWPWTDSSHSKEGEIYCAPGSWKPAEAISVPSGPTP